MQQARWVAVDNGVGQVLAWLTGLSYLVGERRQFVVDAMLYRQPLQTHQNGESVLIYSGAHDDSSKVIYLKDYTVQLVHVRCTGLLVL